MSNRELLEPHQAGELDPNAGFSWRQYFASCQTWSQSKAAIQCLALLIALVSAPIAHLVSGLFVSFDTRVNNRMRLEADVVASKVNHTAESVYHSEGIRPVIEMMTDRPGVQSILVVGDSPLRVIGASHESLEDRLVSKLPLGIQKSELAHAIRTRESLYRVNRTSNTFEYAAPVILSRQEMGDGLLQGGAVLVQLDEAFHRSKVSRAVLKFAISSTIALFVASILVWLFVLPGCWWSLLWGYHALYALVHQARPVPNAAVEPGNLHAKTSAVH